MIAFVAETVGGATAGALLPVPGYFKAVREVCDRHGALLILDEVMCGMGRTGTLHACEQEGIVPDLMTIAKGLGGGYQPIGAVLAQKRIVDAMSAGTGFFQHGHTYLGHPVACAVASALHAEAVVFVTNVAGVVQDERVLPSLTAGEAESLIKAKIIRGGMIPKVRAALDAVNNACCAARITNLEGLANGGGTLFVQ